MIGSEAKWVRGGACESPVIFGKMNCPEGVVSANISICGLGFFELYVNGEKIGNDLLVPAWSDYEPRDNRRLIYPLNDTRSHRTYYLDYDLTDALNPGENVIEVWLGNGWYNQHERNVEGDLWYDKPKLAFTVEMTDAAGNTAYFHSGETLRWRESPIVFNNVYYGEKWDFTRETDPDGQPVELTEAPVNSRLMKQTCPPDREIRTIVPAVVKADGSRTVYDAGENITGYCALSGAGEIVIRYAENIKQTGELDFASAGWERQIQTDEYRTDARRALKPKFSVKGFRYFEVTGDAEDVRVIVVHSDVRVNSSFESSDETLNWLYDAYIRTQLNNMHCGVPSDCPHRERLGYTGDGQLACNAAMLTLDCREFYRKWIGDIMDCQDVNTGHVQHTAPFYGGGGGPGGWGCAVVVVPFMYYSHYGETEFLRECWPHMLKWVSYMESRMENGLIVREEKDGWCLGDWCTPEKVRIPEPLVNTFYFIESLQMMQIIAEAIGEDADFEDRIEECRAALKNAYYGKEISRVQAGDVFLQDIRIGEMEDREEINRRYAESGVFDTGIFGTYLLTHCLFDWGYGDTAFALLTGENPFASFHHMKKSGATTVWEDWDGSNSHDHPMFGAVTDALFEEILGIRPTEPGYTAVDIDPDVPSGLDWVRGHITVPAGEICVDFDRNRSPRYIVTVPDMEVTFRGSALHSGENTFE